MQTQVVLCSKIEKEVKLYFDDPQVAIGSPTEKDLLDCSGKAHCGIGSFLEGQCPAALKKSLVFH